MMDTKERRVGRQGGEREMGNVFTGSLYADYWQKRLGDK